MPREGEAVFRLERGATGFYDPKDGPLPEVDSRALRAAWHSSARAAGGVVVEWLDQKYPRNYHTASLTAGGVLHVALCHAYLPLCCLRLRAESLLPGRVSRSSDVVLASCRLGVRGDERRAVEHPSVRGRHGRPHRHGMAGGALLGRHSAGRRSIQCVGLASRSISSRRSGRVIDQRCDL